MTSSQLVKSVFCRFLCEEGNTSKGKEDLERGVHETQLHSPWSLHQISSLSPFALRPPHVPWPGTSHGASLSCLPATPQPQKPSAYNLTFVFSTGIKKKKKEDLLADELLSKWEHSYRYAKCSFMFMKPLLHCVNAHSQCNREFSITISSRAPVVKSKKPRKCPNAGRFPQRKAC